jgi:hypothetical protein
MRQLHWLVVTLVLVTLLGLPAVQADAAEARVVHVIVALCDNVHQGIVPVPARIGNGDDPDNNLYWGAAFGVRTFFSRSPDWTLVTRQRAVNAFVLERLVFKRRGQNVFLVADAYRGAEIKRGIVDFLAYASGQGRLAIEGIEAAGQADLVAFIGHDGLMDFSLDAWPTRIGTSGRARAAIVLCCASKQYFTRPLQQTGASPLLWTTGLMAPEAYILKAALDGWIAGEGGEAVRERAATAYNQYQKCGIKGARRLFATGW